MGDNPNAVNNNVIIICSSSSSINAFSITGCRDQGDALIVPSVSYKKMAIVKQSNRNGCQ